MKILISYHNFVRDFRGSLLLKLALEELGHQVWMRPFWNDEIAFATVKDVDVIITGQIAEESTSYVARFTQETGRLLVINSTEQVTFPDRFETFITYNCNQLSDGVIALQCVATRDLKEFIDRHPGIRHPEKYKLLGFPRLDLSINENLRHVETPYLVRKYGLERYRRKLLYVSSLLFEESYSDVSEGDKARWQYDKLLERNHAMRRFHEPILDALIQDYLAGDGVLLIKKHPWDVSDYFNRRFRHPNVRVLDDTEYIVPCLDVADAMIHVYSTSAIEAWVLGKPTIALQPASDTGALALNHMRAEVYASSYDELVSKLTNYPRPGPIEDVWNVLGPQGDGLATLRLAREIHRLQPNRNRQPTRPAFRKRWRRELKWWLTDACLLPWNTEAVKNYPKRLRLIQMEQQRASVERRWRAALRRHVRRHAGFLHAPL